jgi:hypothetical protein
MESTGRARTPFIDAIERERRRWCTNRRGEGSITPISAVLSAQLATFSA